MDNQKRPERVFRYFPAEASDFFAAKKFWLSSLKDYNDPFDAFPRFDLLVEGQFNHSIKVEYAFLPPQVNCTYSTFRKTLESDSEVSAFKAEGIEAIADKFRNLADRCFRIVCFSEKLDELLMWGHYASSHRGFVVEFNPQHQIFATDEFERVDYPKTEERPKIKFDDQSEDELLKMLFLKSPHWDYECEWRLAMSVGNSVLKTGKRRDGKELNYLELPMDSILRLYLGWQMPELNHNELISSLEQNDWKHVEKFVMCPDKTKYAIRPIPWEQWQKKPTIYHEQLDQVMPITNKG
jgi:hypothetical protein